MVSLFSLFEFATNEDTLLRKIFFISGDFFVLFQDFFRNISSVSNVACTRRYGNIVAVIFYVKFPQQCFLVCGHLYKRMWQRKTPQKTV